MRTLWTVQLEGKKSTRQAIWSRWRNGSKATQIMKRVCIVGCGAIGSLYAAHLARVAEVWAFVRREEHARALNRDGLRVSGKNEFHDSIRATSRPAKVPCFAFAS